MNSTKTLNIGFISFRFAGTDGVSLETSKWAEVLEEMGHRCFYFAGECDRPADVSMVVPEAHFKHEEIMAQHQRLWHSNQRDHQQTLWIKERTEFFHNHVRRFLDEFEIDLLIPENLLCYPLNIPLSLAVTELIAERRLPTIAHHHDFYWERKSFLVNGAWDYLTMAFPPTLDTIEHAVINSSAAHQLAARRGVSSTIIPNVMNYDVPPPEADDYTADIRENLGLAPDERLILQPTRVVQRKGIEHAVELLSRLGVKAQLVISHATGDDDKGYVERVVSYADLLGVKILFAEKWFDEVRGVSPDGHKVYSLWDIYPFADLVTYPSLFEGFGNAFLEAVYFRKPIVVNNYTIYESDIRTRGFKVICFDDFITDATVAAALEAMNDPHYAENGGQRNYELARNYFSYTTLRNKLRILLYNARGR